MKRKDAKQAWSHKFKSERQRHSYYKLKGIEADEQMIRKLPNELRLEVKDWNHFEIFAEHP